MARALFIALSRVAVAAGAMLAYANTASGVELIAYYAGALDLMAIGAIARYAAASIWWAEHWGIVVRTHWRPFIWFA